MEKKRKINFFFLLVTFKTTEICFGSTKMEIFYREKAFHAEKKKIRKNDFAPQKNFPVTPLTQSQTLGCIFLSNIVQNYLVPDPACLLSITNLDVWFATNIFKALPDAVTLSALGRAATVTLNGDPWTCLSDQVRWRRYAPVVKKENI